MLLTMNLLCLLPVAVLCQDIVSYDTQIILERDDYTTDGDSEDYTEDKYAETEYVVDSEYSSKDSDSDSDDEDSEYQNDDDNDDDDDEDDEDDEDDDDDDSDGSDDDDDDDDNDDDEDDFDSESSESSEGENKVEEKLDHEYDPIQNLTANVIDNDKALLRWNQIVTPDVKDRITNFKVKIQQLRKSKRKHCLLAGGKEEVSEKFMEIIVPANRTEAVFSGMKKGTIYEIVVKSYTAKGKGPKSMKVQIQRT